MLLTEHSLPPLNVKFPNGNCFRCVALLTRKGRSRTWSSLTKNYTKISRIIGV